MNYSSGRKLVFCRGDICSLLEEGGQGGTEGAGGY